MIPIDVGRQLFVDYFLIEDTDLRRTFHKPAYFQVNPILSPDKPWERSGDNSSAIPFSDGVWYDPTSYLRCGTRVRRIRCMPFPGTEWIGEKPPLDVQDGTNIVHTAKRDSSTVWLDFEERDPAKRFKLIYSNGHMKPLSLFFSPDGVHWANRSRRVRQPAIAQLTESFSPGMGLQHSRAYTRRDRPD